MTDFSNLANQLESQNIEHEMISYGGVPHAFTVFDQSRYRADADKKSCKRLIEFLEEN